MNDRSFEELIGNLPEQGMRVYVSTGRGADIYHYSRGCLEGSLRDGRVRKVPEGLVKWLGYKKCNKC